MQMKRIGMKFAVAASVCAFALWSVSASAQPGAPGGPGGPGGRGGGGPQLSPEAAAKAWEIQAKAVAQSLTLNEELTGKLVAAYKAARESQGAALREKLGQVGGQGGQGAAGAAMREVVVAERGKLETALKGFLTPEQTTAALSSLGAFNRRWDGMVNTLEGLGLEDAKKAEAMTVVSAYAAESGKLMESAAASGDFESVREKGRELREKLDADIAKVLTEEQLAKWKEQTAMRRGGGGGPGGPGGGPGGPGGAGAPAGAGAPGAAPGGERPKGAERKAE